MGYDDDGIELYFINQQNPDASAVSLREQGVHSYGEIYAQDELICKAKPNTIVILTDGIWEGMSGQHAVDNLITQYLKRLRIVHPGSATLAAWSPFGRFQFSSSASNRTLVRRIAYAALTTTQKEANGLTMLPQSCLSALREWFDALFANGLFRDIVGCEPSNGDVHTMLLSSLFKDMDQKLNEYYFTELTVSLEKLLSQEWRHLY